MQLPTPGPQYDPRDEAAARDILMRADAQNLKRGRPIEVGGTTVRGDATVTGEVVVSGGLQFAASISPGALGGDQDDYEPTDFLTTGYVRLSASAPVNITGLGRDAAAHVKFLSNVGANAITLKHESGSSTANKRFNLANATDFVLATGATVILLYDGTSDRWRMVGS